MHRRTVIKALVVAGAAASAGACSTSAQPATDQPKASPSKSAPGTGSPGGTTPTPGTTPPGATPPGTTAPGTAPAGTAPTRTFSLKTSQVAFSRGDRPLPTTIWQPSGNGSFPLILFSHGLTARPRDYAEMITAWAKAGFVVAAPAYPFTAGGVSDFNPLDVVNQPADASYVITRVLERLGGAVDAGRIAAAGHSAGGMTTLGMFSGNRDARLRAGVVLAGRQIVATPLTGAPSPLLFVHGKLDNTIAYADGRSVFDAMSWPKAFLTFPRGGHVATGRSLDVISATSRDFWRWSLYGDRSAKARLGQDAAANDLATFTNRL
ncbi:alpha/beta hydrolase family protein [Paractinoplanes toevensis]|uniref:alpha/beta hydrolase family protein n=1 Tax=Paractinoplanes toevensis TaxID=571911 RepID=UPI001BB31D87|nr:chlorophyllase [Actinoplanes toevensis]